MLHCVKRLDLYIIKKFLGTFFLSIVLILSIAVVFDLTEKLDDFYENQVPLHEIVFDYYLNFIPYYLDMFSQLFIFISVIFFTSKMAGNSEVIAILAAGVSYERFLRPYLVTATFLFVFSFGLGGWVIPQASKKMLTFTDKYIEKFTHENARNVQMVVSEGTVLYIESFQMRTRMGYRASLEHFEGKSLTQRITADRIRHVEEYTWRLENFTERRFDGMRETLLQGQSMDTIIPILPEELFITAEQAQQMTNPELHQYIQKQRERGAGNVKAFETEWYTRFAGPLGAFIMTLLGVTLSSKKVRGGMGKNLGIGVALTALYILFSTVSTTFSVSGVMSPFMSVWLPNLVFLVVAFVLYLRVRK
ncbi:MAG: LptF/LptG family permease [Paludibacteraceae bacterium]|nr:LptF/LptG family permease [Paludibacteraceae bacterium]